MALSQVVSISLCRTRLGARFHIDKEHHGCKIQYLGNPPNGGDPMKEWGFFASRVLVDTTQI